MGDPSKALQLRNELPDKRTANSRTFGSHNGTLTTEIFVRPIHYKDAAGRWQKIDNRLKASSRTGFAWENTANRFKAFLSPSTWGDLVRVELEGKAVSFKLVGSQSATVTTQDNRASFAGVFPKTDLRFDVREDRIKEEIVLLDKDPATLDRSFTFELRLEGLEARKESGQVGFYSGTKRLMFIPAPFMYDSADKDKTRPPAYSKDVQTELSGTGSTYKLVLKADVAWLSDPARLFPVYIDPTIVMQPDGESGKDSYLDSAFPSEPHGSYPDLVVGTEANGRKFRSVLQFDLSYLPAGQYPPPTIYSARLYLYRNYTPWPPDTTVNVHRITSSWKESEVSWLNKSSGVAWSTQGGDYDATPSGSFVPPAPFYWATVDNITNLVTGWVDGDYANYGMLLKFGTEDTTDKFYSFASDSGSGPPKLEINYYSDASAGTTGLEPQHGAVSWNLGAGMSLYATQVSASNVVLKKDLISIPARGPGFDLSLVYNYRAADNRSGATNIGANWWFSLPRIAPFGDSVLFYDEDATYTFFTNKTDQGDNTFKYRTPAGLRYTLIEDANANLFYLKHDGGLVQEFDRINNMAGLGSIVGPFRKSLKTYDSFHLVNNLPVNYLSYGYTDNYITTITDSSDSPRSVTLSWDEGWSSGSKVLKTITDPAGIITTLNYQSYGPEGNKEAYLMSITEATRTADERTVSFGYEPYSETEWSARLTAVTDARTDPGNHSTTIEYDTTYFHKPVKKVTDARGKATSFSYHTSMADGDWVYVEDDLGALNRSVAAGNKLGAVYFGNTYNASFERPGSGSYPEKWGFYGDPNYATGSRDTAVSYKGAASARTTHTGSVYSYWDQWLNNNYVFASPGTPYTGKVWMKLSNVTGAAYMRVWYFNEEGWYWEMADSPFYTGTRDWFEISTSTFTFPVNWTVHRVMLVWLILDGAGTVWWDMARVESTGMQATWDSNLMTNFTDGAGLTSTLTWGGNETNNPNGNPNNLVSAQDHLGNKVTYKYDRKNHVIEAQTPNDQISGKKKVYTYNLVTGDLEKAEDEVNHTWKMEQYDAYGQFWKLKDPNASALDPANPTGMTYDYTYNGYGYGTEIKVPKDSSSGWLTTRMEYDNLRGLLTLKTDATNQKTRYEYDNLYRVKKITYNFEAAGQYDVTYTYDKNDNRLTMLDYRGTTTYQYWENNLPLLVTEPEGDKRFWYFFDGVGNLTSTAMQRSPTVYDWVYYYYDNRGRPVAVYNPYDQQFSNFRYDNKGRLGRQEVPGIVLEYGYRNGVDQDQGNRLMKQEVKRGGQLLRSFAYTYDANGNIKTATENDGSVTTYQYTDIDQLSSASRTGAAPFIQSLAYDPNGNRKTMIKDGATWTYTYNAANFLTWTQKNQEPPYALSWYDDGNLQREGNPGDYSYTYDGAENLKLLNVGAEPPEFEYFSNGNGRRVSKVAPDGGYGYFYSLLGLALEQKNLLDQAKYVRLPNDTPLAINNTSGTYYYFQDASGNVRALLNSSGIQAEYRYYPFGEVLTEPNPDPIYNPLRFGASYRDQEGGSANKMQYYMMARYYDPTYGRFIAGEATPLNYAYAGNNPVNFIDASGRWDIPAWWKAFWSSNADANKAFVAAWNQSRGERPMTFWELLETLSYVPVPVGIVGRLGAEAIIATRARTITPAIAKILNRNLGMNLQAREWGNALKELKRGRGIPHNYHGKIGEFGGFYDRAGNFLADIPDFLP